METTKAQKNIPSGWKEKSLGSFLSISKGKLPKKTYEATDENSLPYLSIKHLDGNESKYAMKSDGVVADKNDLLVVADGSGSGRMYRGYYGLVSSTFLKISTKSPDEISNDYLEVLFSHLDFTNSRFRKGGAIPHFDFKQLKDVAILLPPIKEQQKIAEILGTVDEDIAKTQEVIEVTEKLKRGLMQQLFTRGIGHTKFKETEIGKIPIEWKTVSLGKYVDIRSGDSPSGFNFEINAMYPFYKVEEMNHSAKYMASTRYFFNSYNKPLMPKGMIIFPKRGAAIYMNKVRILSSDSYFDTNVMGLITKNGLYSEYLYYLLIHIGLSQFADTTSVAQINNKHIEPLLIPLPENNEQKEIAEILSAVDEKISVNKKLKEKLTLLKKGMMQDLLSGKVRTIVN